MEKKVKKSTSAKSALKKQIVKAVAKKKVAPKSKEKKITVKKIASTKKITLPPIDLKELLEAGCHFGHRVSRTHPKIRPYLYASRDGIQVFDLIKTGAMLDEARHFVAEKAAAGEKIIFIGTKRQARKIIRQVAKEAGSPFVNIRWLGGFLTNWKEMEKRIKKLKKMEEQWETGAFSKRTKYEQSQIKKEMALLREKFGGLVDLTRLPAAIFVVDAMREKAAIAEAKYLRIPIIALVDSNTDPTGIDYPIPANDDARKSVELIVQILGGAVKEGQKLITPVKEEKK